MGSRSDKSMFRLCSRLATALDFTAMGTHSQSKPKGRLKAHDGYSFFIKFYLATLVFIGVMATIFLIGSNNFAKECSLQVTLTPHSTQNGF